MIKISLDEAYAFDYLSILSIKEDQGVVDSLTPNLCKGEIMEGIGVSKYASIINSPEYKILYEANLKTFAAVDKAKEDKVTASYVDNCNYERYLAKRALQKKFFEASLSERKSQ